MGKDLTEAFPVARRTFEEADEVLGYGLSDLAWNGPEDELTETRHAQPALFVHSIAVYRTIAERLDDVILAAGHSLGELSAHGAAGSYAFADGLRAVRRRGELMFQAGLEEPGTMAAVLGLDDEGVSDLCSRAAEAGQVLVPANLNSAGQVVVSGSMAGVAWGMEAAKEAGAKKVVQLKVSGAFHSPLMAPAAADFEATLNEIVFQGPGFPVVSNVTSEPVDDPAQVKELLVRQLTSPVLWSKSIKTMVDAGTTRFLELGPGKVLTGLNRRNAKGIASRAVGTADDVEAFLSDES